MERERPAGGILPPSILRSYRSLHCFLQVTYGQARADEEIVCRVVQRTVHVPTVEPVEASQRGVGGQRTGASRYRHLGEDKVSGTGQVPDTFAPGHFPLERVLKCPNCDVLSRRR
jgi:hypothetical protein